MTEWWAAIRVCVVAIPLVFAGGNPYQDPASGLSRSRRARQAKLSACRTARPKNDGRWRVRGSPSRTTTTTRKIPQISISTLEGFRLKKADVTPGQSLQQRSPTERFFHHRDPPAEGIA